MKMSRCRVGRFCSTLVGLLLALGIAAPVSAGTGSHAVNASMVALIASPNRFDGKLIRTYGVLCLTKQDEGDALYLHEEDLRFAIDSNSLSLHMNEEEKRRFRAANLRHVLLEGTFHANVPGAYQSGSISQIRRLEIWEEHPQESADAAGCPVPINPKHM